MVLKVLILVKPSIGLTSTEDNGKLRDLRRKHGDIHKLEGLCRFENYQITVLKYKLFDVCASVWKETQIVPKLIVIVLFLNGFFNG